MNETKSYADRAKKRRIELIGSFTSEWVKEKKKGDEYIYLLSYHYRLQQLVELLALKEEPRTDRLINEQVSKGEEGRRKVMNIFIFYRLQQLVESAVCTVWKKNQELKNKIRWQITPQWIYIYINKYSVPLLHADYNRSRTSALSNWLGTH